MDLHPADPLAEAQSGCVAHYLDGQTRCVQVSLVTSFGHQKCGRIEFNRVDKFARFVYEPSYTGPSLDPVNLPVSVSSRSFLVDPEHNPELLHRVFLDYMPGVWGLNILLGEFPYLKGMLAAEKLHWLGSRTVGSLAFHVDQAEGEAPVNGVSKLEEVRRRSVDLAMGRLTRVGSLDLEAGVGPTSPWIVEGLAAFGGARPKCIFKDHKGSQWLAKFNLEGDPYNCARVEHATALLSRLAGIHTVTTRCVRVPGANDILFVRRFDRNDSSINHKVSFYSLFPPDRVKHHSGGDYRLIFEILPRVLHDLESSRRELILRMLFNVAVNNTDDHLKNFELIANDKNGRFELSPAFDVTIDVYPSLRSTSVFGLNGPSLSDEHLMHIAEAIDEPISTLEACRAQVLGALSKWRDVFKLAGVNERDQKRVSRMLDRTMT